MEQPYCGTPFVHCVNTFGPFKRGNTLLANLEILSTFLFVFLPESGEFMDHRKQKNYLLDIFDHQT